jgi:hypothetical protein
MTRTENSPEQPADGAGSTTGGECRPTGFSCPGTAGSRGTVDRRHCPGGRGSRWGGRGGPSGRCQAGRGRTLSAFGAGLRRNRLSQRWVQFSAQRYLFGQKRIDVEDLGPTLEMLLGLHNLEILHDVAWLWLSRTNAKPSMVLLVRTRLGRPFLPRSRPGVAID